MERVKQLHLLFREIQGRLPWRTSKRLVLISARPNRNAQTKPLSPDLLIMQPTRMTFCERLPLGRARCSTKRKRLRRYAPGRPAVLRARRSHALETALGAARPVRADVLSRHNRPLISQGVHISSRLTRPGTPCLENLMSSPLTPSACLPYAWQSSSTSISGAALRQEANLLI